MFLLDFIEDNHVHHYLVHHPLVVEACSDGEDEPDIYSAFLFIVIFFQLNGCLPELQNS